MKPGLVKHGGLELAEAVRIAYSQSQTDYNLSPLVAVDDRGEAVGRIKDGDTVLFCCRRGEREVELTEVFTEDNYSHFDRPKFKHLTFVILTLYHEKFKTLPVAFAPVGIKNTLGVAVSRAGKKQVRIAESEKFAHVTFFFNGGSRLNFPGEADICIPSPKGVSFEQTPELSLPQVMEQVVFQIKNNTDFIVTNFANGDVIGHTTNTAAKIACAEAVDKALGQVTREALAAGYVVMITADHGNLEVLSQADGTPHVSHTGNPVPFFLIDPLNRIKLRPRDGRLADIAPTILHAMGIPLPEEFTGENLVPGHHWGANRRVLLVILDGWGIGSEDANNPIHLAATPFWDSLNRNYMPSSLTASGQDVGLNLGKAGNSEAGHMNIGAGRVVPQDDVRLDQAMIDGSFYTNEIMLTAIRKVKQQHTSFHILGLLSEKSSHGSIEYALAALRMAKLEGMQEVYLHVIFDGRSTEPGSAPAMLEILESRVTEIGIGKIVSGLGRGIALDRDGNYSRIQQAFEALVYGIGTPFHV